MADYSHRFVPPSTQFIQPVRMVIQLGHEAPVIAIQFSEDGLFIASLDTAMNLKIWCVETVEVLGTYHIPFIADTLQWDHSRSVTVLAKQDENQKIVIPIEEEESTAPENAQDASQGMNFIPMLDALSVKSESDGIHIEQYGNEWIYEKPGILNAVVDPFERYVVFSDESTVYVLNITERTETFSKTLKDGRIFKLAISPRGDDVLIIQASGDIWTLNPMKQKMTLFAQTGARILSCDVRDWNLLAVGDDAAHITVYDIKSRSRLFKTPKKQNDFLCYLPLAEKSGVVAFRSESMSAFFTETHEIEPAMPLSGVFSAATPGFQKSEVFVSLTNGDVFRVQLAEQLVEKLCTLPSPAIRMAAGNDAFIVWCEDKTLRIFNGDSLQTLDYPGETPEYLAMNEMSTMAAVYAAGKLFIYKKGKLSLSVEVENIQSLVWGRQKSTSVLYFVNRDQELFKCDPTSGEISLIKSIVSPYTQHAKPLGISCSEKNSACILYDADHNQKVMIRVSLSTGKVSFALRIFGAGAILWGAIDADQYLYMRADTGCIRFVKGKNTFELDQWMNSEPLAII